MTSEEFNFELRAFLAKEVALIRKTLPYKTGLLSGQLGSGGFSLSKTDKGYKISIDVSKVFYTPYVDDETWVSPRTGQPKRTAGFWNKLVLNRFIKDLKVFLEGMGEING